MAHRGPGAKPIKHGRTPNAEWTEVVNKPYEGPSPDLPKLGRNRKWPVVVDEWWSDVRRMPHCGLWQPTDWRFALETAYLKAQFWNDYNNGEVKSTMATEIRRREDILGVTAEARRQLRIRYLDPAEAEQGQEEDIEPGTAVAVVEDLEDADPGVGTVTPLASRRRRLAG